MDWLLANRIALEDFALVSVVVAIVSFLGVVIVLVRLPQDYFLGEERFPLREQTGARFSISVIVKNAVGIVMIALGLLMLVLPGQGTLFILAGLFFTNFPGKFQLERRIIRSSAISSTVNRLRGWFDQPPLRVPD